MSRALETFTVSHAGLRLRVRLLPSHREVEREFHAGRRRRDGRFIHAYFAPTKSQSARHGGAIVLAGNGRLQELVPHEVTHAVMHRLGAAHCTDDEPLATAVGILTARILGRLDRLGYL